jgi:hypothetical protein
MTADGTWTIDKLFEGRAEARRLFEGVRIEIEKFGPVKVTPLKTQVSFGTDRKFAWVWLPQTWIKKRPEGSVTLTFSLPNEVVDSRIVQALEPYPGRWTHHVIIESKSDLDQTVLSWLREAYVNSKR